MQNRVSTGGVLTHFMLTGLLVRKYYAPLIFPRATAESLSVPRPDSHS